MKGFGQNNNDMRLESNFANKAELDFTLSIDRIGVQKYVDIPEIGNAG
jgi:hypothetical protein